MWRCAEGHEFIEYVNNIRRSPQSKRKCSWCKKCKKEGYIFIWDNDKYKSKIIKPNDNDSSSSSNNDDIITTTMNNNTTTTTNYLHA